MMGLHHEQCHRRSIRLQGYDYAQVGAYFVTICTYQKECVFGQVVGGEMRVNGGGEIVLSAWNSLPDRFPSIVLDSFIIMPNHVHGIVMLGAINDVGAGQALPEKRGAASSAPTMNKITTFGDAVRAFKSISAIQVSRLLGRKGLPLWQRNYYEHIIRNEQSLDSIRQYIVNNPLRWAGDGENPVNAPKT